jgi:hypothetical protein
MLSAIIKKYSQHDSKVLTGYHRYGDGRTWGKPDGALGDLRMARELVAWADVIIMHNGGRHRNVRALPLRGKRLIAYYHSEPQQVDRFWEQRGVPTYVISQGHSLLYPKMPTLPNLVDIEDPLLQPASNYLNNEIVIGYAPSTTKDDPEFRKAFPFSSKGWPRTKPVLDRLFKEGHADIRIFQGLPWAECMEARKRCTVMIDEVVTGSYHRSTLEAGCHGQLVVNGLSEAVRKIVLDLTGAADVPWLRSSAETLYDEMRAVIADRRGLGERMVSTRRWMETYWHPKALLERHWLPALERAPMAK